MPVVDPYSELLARNEIEQQLAQRRPGDRSSFNGGAMNGVNGSSGYGNGTPKQRKSYYDEQFGSRDAASGSAREKVQRESPIIAELRTNVIVGGFDFTCGRRAIAG